MLAWNLVRNNAATCLGKALRYQTSFFGLVFTQQLIQLCHNYATWPFYIPFMCLSLKVLLGAGFEVT